MYIIIIFTHSTFNMFHSPRAISLEMSLQVVLFSFLVSVVAAENHTWQCSEVCPLWTAADWSRNNSCECKCGSDIEGVVACEDGKGVSTISNCFCMTATEGKGRPLVGSCYSTCLIRSKTRYTLETTDVKSLNNESCAPYNRRGFFCGECIEGYGLSVYSYNMSCVECSDYKYNWAKYIAVAYIPLTLFCFIIFLFRISVTSGWIIAYVTLSQVITIKGFVSWQLLQTSPDSGLRLAAKILISMSSIWNLDFLRSFCPPICLHPSLPALQVFMLDYMVALYPLVLVLLAYTLVKLHDRFVLVTWLCRPLYTCFRHFRKEWDIKTSIIGALASFYLLAYVKIINVTADILAAISFTDMNGESYGEYFFFYNASLRYFGPEHRPYAVFAIVVSLVINICPLILFLFYPCRCFHRCLNRTGCRCHTLHLLMDAVLGSYSYQPRERRYFGAVYFFLRMVNVLAFTSLRLFAYLTGCTYGTMIVIVSVVIFRPFKLRGQNIITVVLFAAVFHCYLLAMLYQLGIALNPTDIQIRIYPYLLFVSVIFLPLYGLVALIRRVVPWNVAVTMCSNLCKQSSSIELEESLPYRLKHHLLSDQ